MGLSTPLPGLVGHPAPPLRPQSLRASSQESTGTANTRGGAGTGQKSVFEKTVGGVPTLRQWWGPVPAPSGPAPRQGGAPNYALLNTPGMGLYGAVCREQKNICQTTLDFGRISAVWAPSLREPSMQNPCPE